LTSLKDTTIFVTIAVKTTSMSPCNCWHQSAAGYQAQASWEHRGHNKAGKWFVLRAAMFVWRLNIHNPLSLSDYCSTWRRNHHLIFCSTWEGTSRPDIILHAWDVTINPNVNVTRN
jgi:hypothetical protein